MKGTRKIKNRQKKKPASGLAKATFFGLMACMLCLLCVPSSALAQQSRYRKVQGNRGNCIFSTSPLPHRRESVYRNIKKRIKVKPGLIIYARCYMPHKLHLYTRKGRVFNQMRCYRRYESTMWFGGAKRASTRILKRRYSIKHRNRDQSYTILGRTKGCSYCKDFIKMGKRLWTKPGARIRKFCLMDTVTFADRYRRRWVRTRRGLKQLVKKRLWMMHHGCVELVYPK